MIRLGIDFGGTKIEAAAIDRHGSFVSRIRTETPDNYTDALLEIAKLVSMIEDEVGNSCSVGIGMPGFLCHKTQLVRNSNRLYMNGKPFSRDIENALKRPVKIANDANCFALSEALDGAGKDTKIVCGIILGTGCGGGLVIDSRLVEGANRIAAEWGHNPLPWPSYDEMNAPKCYCGKSGCLEQWISGTALSRCYEGRTKIKISGEEIATLASEGKTAAVFEVAALTDRIGRAIAHICNVVDPGAIVLGGGISNISSLYNDLPDIINKYVFVDKWEGKILRPKWGDSSGVRGAARLWG